MSDKLKIILILVVLAWAISYPDHLQAQYKVPKSKVIGWSVLAVTGFIDGAVEGYEFDGRTSFERKYGADPSGFWGSSSWENKDNWYAKNFGVFDYYHVSDDLRKIGYITGGVIITLGEKQKIEHLLLDVGIGLLVSAGTKRAGLHWIRN
jgi:hypothetical protein